MRRRIRSLKHAQKQFPTAGVSDYYRDKLGRSMLYISCVGCGKKLWVRWDVLQEKKRKGEELTAGHMVCRNKRRRTTLDDVKKQFPHLNISGIRWVQYTQQKVAQVRIMCPGQCAGLVCGRWRWVFVTSLQKELKHRKKQPGLCQACTMRAKGKTCDGHSRRKDGYAEIKFQGRTIMLHRLIMEQKIGRRLRKGETVHHRNGKRRDNQIENLELRFNGKHPRGLNIADLIYTLESVPGIKVLVSEQAQVLLENPLQKAA
jgi:HNH endonuclease